jgi:hypothetical protein
MKWIQREIAGTQSMSASERVRDDVMPMIGAASRRRA